MKTIGVLGGVGPQATIDFEVRLHRISQNLIPPNGNSGYPPMVVYYYRHPPFLLQEDSSPRLPFQPDPRLLEAAKLLGSVADFLVITANAPHLFLEQIEQAARRKVLSMVEATLAAVNQRQWRKVGVVGFGNPLVYTDPLERLNIACETIDTDLRAQLDGAIRKVMEGRNDLESSAIAQTAIKTLRARKVDGLILGCTEIPLLLQESANEPDLLNPVQLLAEAAVRYSLA
jgi:aspartate racemase